MLKTTKPFSYGRPMERGWHILDFIVFNTQKCKIFYKKCSCYYLLSKMELFAMGMTNHKHLRLRVLHFPTITTFSRQLLLQSSTPHMFVGILDLSLGRKAVIKKAA